MKIRKLRYWILAGDSVWIIGALGLAIYLHYVGTRGDIGFMQHFQTYSLMLSVAFVVWPLLYFEMSLDGFKGGWHIPAILSKIIVAVSLLMVVVPAFAFLTQNNYSRIVLLYFALFFAAGLVGLRCLFRLLVASYPRNGCDNRCVILGNGPVAKELAVKFASHPELPFYVVGFLFPGESEATNGFATSLGPSVTSVKTLQVLELLAQRKIQKVIIAMSQSNSAEVRKLVDECRKAAIQVYLVPQWYDLYVSKAELVEIDGLPLLSLEERNRPVVNVALKRVMDVVLSMGLLILVSPLFLFAAFFVYSKKGRAFTTELRCTKDGIPFRMYRLNVDRRAAKAPLYERLFVRWSLTELPQLWNVLRGDMSLVGPRPESAERLKYYSEWQRQRLKVRGGVTGLAQVHGLREQHSSEDKARFDLQYILNWSPFLDLSLILQTVWTLVMRGLSQEPASVQPRNSHSSASHYVTKEAVDANRPQPSTD
jgi:lipopolysaccharide/colanic/teichoic acid biosynthesis glycosyltransferase